MTIKEQELPEDVQQWLEAEPSNYEHLDLIVAPPLPDEAVLEFPDAEETQVLKHSESGIVGFPGSRLAFYMVLRRRGESHRIAEMLAMQRAPRANTDDTFFSGMGTLLDSVDGNQKRLKKLVAAARRRGYEPSAGDAYFPNLADGEGDPDAFVSRSRGTSHIRKVCEKRGWECRGSVKVKAREPESDPYLNRKPLGEDIIQRTAAVMMQKDPSLRSVPRRELRERIIDKHGQKP